MGVYNMFKTISAAALAFSTMTSAEQMFTDGHFHYSELMNSYPPVTTPLTFVQTSGQENFQLLLDGTTKGVPDPPSSTIPPSSPSEVSLPTPSLSLTSSS